MNINVINNIPNLKVTINEEENGLSILLSEANKKRLAEIPEGKPVKLGERTYIVLEQNEAEGTTILLDSEFACKMRFGDSSDLPKSGVDTYLHGKYMDGLVEAVGRENIIEHEIDLTALDGTNAGVTYTGFIFPLTIDLYRKYRKHIPAYGDCWWLANPWSKEEGYSRNVCYVNSLGTVNWCNCIWNGYGVRPFCKLNSSILVPCDNNE